MCATHTYQMCRWGLGQILNKRVVWYPKQPEEEKEGEDGLTLITKMVVCGFAKWVRDLWQPY